MSNWRRVRMVSGMSPSPQALSMDGIGPSAMITRKPADGERWPRPSPRVLLPPPVRPYPRRLGCGSPSEEHQLRAEARSHRSKERIRARGRTPPATDFLKNQEDRGGRQVAGLTKAMPGG